ncbi:MAG TPA: hypothetical protein VGG19_07280 [Tepidisphaeraceae bacterium]
MMFCQDVDLLYWDQQIFSNASAGQLVINTSGNISGTVITSSTLTLTDYDVQPGQVVSLTGGTSGLFPVLEVTATTMTISLLSEGLEPDDGSSGSPVLPPTSTGSVTFSIRTLWPYRRVITDQLLAAAGVPSTPVGGITPTLLNPQDFKRACALGSLAMAYSALNAATLVSSAAAASQYEARSTAYSTLFSSALRNIRAELDWNNDGKADELRYLAEIHLRRE